ncbi:MAG TPA: hypothetical protein VGL93_10450 [Streptosporangiaceae bacterium]|jgi:hypothetical protein
MTSTETRPNWRNLETGDFYTRTGTQLGLFAAPDATGTGDLFDQDDTPATAPAKPTKKAARAAARAARAALDAKIAAHLMDIKAIGAAYENWLIDQYGIDGSRTYNVVFAAKEISGLPLHELRNLYQEATR